MSSLDDRLVDEIYEAAVVPDFWPSVLDRVSTCSNSRAGGLIVVDPQQRPRAVATETYRPTYESFARSDLDRYENIRAERAMAMRHAGFLRDVDLCTTEELTDDPIYRDFLRPHGLGWTSGTFAPIPSGDLLIFDFARRIEDGPHARADIGVFDLYRPHLARAALLSARLGLDRAHGMAEAMTTLGLPAAILAPRGRPIAENDAFAALRRRVEPVLWGRRFGDMLFREETAGAAALRSFPVAASEVEPALVVHVMPIRRAARDVFSGASSIVVVTPVVAPSAPSAEIVAGLFDLTPAEARAARALAEGCGIEDSARRFGVSPETIRTQIKTAMAKTDTHRQVDFVRLLLGAAGLPRFDGDA